MATSITKKSQDIIMLIAGAVISLLALILMVVSYTYIQKLEKIKCQCSEHPYRKFIKNYLLFAITWMVVSLFLSPFIVKSKFSMIYNFASLLYGIATFVFFIIALRYVRFLMKEKCKCSEDIRREVLYVWSIIEIVIISILLILPIVVSIIMTTSGVVMSGTKEFISKEPAVMREAVANPIKSLKKVPASLKKTGKMFGKK